ncbi:LysR family transcriptional regulator [Streptomyces virens]|jgi:molybdate transport repressor ModE-like protein|uniref:LysR family transcriptional regulator n=1 Tax=Streptomyces virens TaxID=285572 RepID=A0ABP6PV93_9ACTN|nr:MULTISPECIES: LysR family transcriptional regulator [Streptomyces]MBA8979747.1 molybdate transport repressor ModE-like protein [Streptomyces calvus]MYS30408.1 LysR family transcriptional regulator [Streptomyces sp. SID7804]
MDLQLRHLRQLCLVSDTGSLNKAAKALGLPQPALSRQIRRLEELFGGALFERDRHGTRPTPLGSAVLADAQGILRSFDAFAQQLRDYRALRSRTLRIGWAHSVHCVALLNALRPLASHERVQIVAPNSTRELMDLLRAGEVDIALRDHASTSGPPPEGDGRIGYVPWAESPIRVAVAADRPLAAAERLTMADLAGEDWISCSGPDACDEELRRLCASYGFAPRITHDIVMSGPRGQVIRHQGCVALTQARRPVDPGVVQRPVADLDMRVTHLVAFRDWTAPLMPKLVALLSAALRERTPAAELS